MTNEKMALSVGAGPGQRALAAVGGVVFSAFGAIFVLLPMVADRLLTRLTGYGAIPSRRTTTRGTCRPACFRRP